MGAGRHSRHDVAQPVHLRRAGVPLDRVAVPGDVLLDADTVVHAGVVVGDAITAGCQRLSLLTVHRLKHEAGDRLDEVDPFAAAELAFDTADVVDRRAARH